MCNPTFSSTTNRITSSGYTFDASGNTTADPLSRTFVYDGENKQTSVSNSGGDIGLYSYDGDGKRIKKIDTTGGTLFLYDAAGKLVEEVFNATPICEEGEKDCEIPGPVTTSYVYAGSRLLTTETSSATTYLTADHLGSPRINTDGSGNVVARHDYMAFGEEIFTALTAQRTSGVGYPGGDGVRKQFTGYERDSETGLDFAQARTFSSTLGRFTTADSLLGSGNPVNPQTLNRYIYCFNNPLDLVDSGGEWPTVRHQAFINEAFQGLSTSERALMMAGSNSVDTLFATGGYIDIPITLISGEAPKHAMTPGGMGRDEAIDHAEDWIEGNLQTALSNARGGMLGAMFSFGKGAHTLMDSTSPSHTGFQEYKYPNTGNPIDDALTWIQEMLEHKRQEDRDPTPEETSNTIMLLRSHYLATFGLREFQRAVPNQDDQNNVIEFMRRLGLGFSDGGLPTDFKIKRTRPRTVDSPIPGSKKDDNTA
jgi:RHS repeat-associated protein